MNSENTARDASAKLKVHTILSVLTFVTGLLLLIYMVSVESEPGALPLLLVVVGTVWYVVTRARIRSHPG
ncbi:MAG TPA: hypothetical protein VGB53_16495 [Rubricoccaceae bacterium]|jgi:hypothetical protein